MKTVVKTASISAVTFLLISIPAVATANQCGAISPLLNSLGDDYFHVDTYSNSSTSQHTHSIVSEHPVISRLRTANYKSGTGTRTQCVGSGNAVVARTSTVELKDIRVGKERLGKQHLDHNTLLKAYEYDESQRRLRSQTIAIPATASQWLDTGVTPDTIQSNTRRRQGTELGSIFRETALSATHTEQALVIHQSVYVNGTLAEWVTWRLVE